MDRTNPARAQLDQILGQLEDKMIKGTITPDEQDWYDVLVMKWKAAGQTDA